MPRLHEVNDLHDPTPLFPIPSGLRRCLAVGILLLCCVWSLSAAEPAPSPVVRLGELLVEDSREDRDLLATPTLESASLEIATASVTSEQIRLQAAGSLVDALEFAPGMLVETRGRKEKQLVSFRGQIYPYPDFALNGVWQRSFYEVPAFLPAAAIERIEILRSGGAIMVGPNSGLVGAINVVPRRFDEPTTVFDALYGSHATFRESVVHGNRLERGYYTLGLSRYSTDGPEDENAAERFATLFGTAGFDPSEGIHLEITGFYLNGQRELRLIQSPGDNRFKTQYEQYDPYRSYGVIGRALFTHSDAASTEIDLGYARRIGNYERNDRTGLNARELDWEYNAGILHARNLSDNNTLRLGAQYNHWVSPRGKRFFVGTRMDVETYSLVLMDEHRFERLTVDAGVRYTQTWYRDYTDAGFNISGTRMSGRGISDDWGDPVLIGTLGAKYALAGPFSLYAHAAAGTVDAPPGALAAAGDSLEREQRLILDGGIRVEDPALGMVQVGGFLVNRRDAITLSETRITSDGDVFNLYTNADVRQYGLEMEARTATFRDILSGYLSATLMTSERRSGNGWSDYREMPDRIVTGGIYMEFGPVDINLFGRYVSSFANRRFAQDGRYHDLGDFFDLNLTAGYSFGKDKATRIYCSFENLLDDEYSTVVGYPDYGLQAFIGLQHQM